MRSESEKAVHSESEYQVGKNADKGTVPRSQDCRDEIRLAPSPRIINKHAYMVAAQRGMLRSREALIRLVECAPLGLE